MDRIENHPILGETPKRKKVTFSYNGQIIEGFLFQKRSRMQREMYHLE